MSTLNIALVNRSASSTVYAYITGLAINNGNALFLLSSDGQTPYFPTSPSATGTSLAQNVSISLGAPGSTRMVTIPQIAGGRIWFCIGTTLTFLLNPGPALVEPSVTNPSDPNINKRWHFCEFTFNSSQLFANISYVDFVCLPISLSLQNTSGQLHHVSGMPAGSLTTVCNALKEQSAKDGQPWRNLIVIGPDGSYLRALSPNNGIVMNPGWFATYWNEYITEVFAQYYNRPLTVNSQTSYGVFNGEVTAASPLLNFGGNVGSFARPTARDIFSCSTGPFATGSSIERNAVIPRLAAAFNRATLLISSHQPNGVKFSEYYLNPVCNHYSRIVHVANLDGKGYAFPYDDVTPTGGRDQAGVVYDPNPALFTVAVGGEGASV